MANNVLCSAASHGAVATASSSFNAELVPSTCIDGSRLSPSRWTSATSGHPHWLQVDFDGPHNISELNVVGVQNDYANPLTPTLSMVGASYLPTAFVIQYWDGDSWEDVPGTSSTNNISVWRQFILETPVSTDKIRLYITASQTASYASLVELEAWEYHASTPNIILRSAADQGAVATASTYYDTTVLPSNCINRGRVSPSRWTSATSGHPHWLQVDFADTYDISEFNVIGVQDAYTSPSTPTLTMTGTKYLPTAFAVQYWDGDSWEDVPGASVTGNNFVWRQFILETPVSTDKIRLYITASQSGSYANLVEFEAWEYVITEPLPDPTAYPRPSIINS